MVCSREEFAREILQQLKINAQIIPVTTNQADFTSRHPSYTVLDHLILSILNDYQLITWQDAFLIILKGGSVVKKVNLV